MTTQRYVSPELTHFVGRRLAPDEEAQYERLLHVVRSGKLRSQGSDELAAWHDTAIARERSIRHYSVAVDETKVLSSNEKYQGGVVCFADIPVNDLSLHTRKYSRFGMSFKRNFVAEQGANPVFYVALDSATHEQNPAFADLILSSAGRPTATAVDPAALEHLTRRQVFDAADAACDEEFALSTREAESQSERQAAVRKFLLWHVFPFFKFFNHRLADEHDDNYYMEREWRLAGILKFKLTDIERLLVPREFGTRLRADLAEYAGQISWV